VASGITFKVEENLGFSLKEKASIKNWISKILKQEGKTPGSISYFFCTDEYLLHINRQFLQHDFYTDIITFDYSEKNESGRRNIYKYRPGERERTFIQTTL